MTIELDQLVEDCKKGEKYYIIGCGLGDQMLSLAYMQKDNLCDIKLVCCWPRSYADFIEEQSLIEVTRYISYPDFVTYIYSHGGEIHHSPQYVEEIAKQMNLLLGMPALNSNYNIETLYSRKDTTELTPINIPYDSIFFAEQFLMDFQNKPYCIIAPYSATSSPDSAWKHWNELMHYLLSTYKDVFFFFVGTDWDYGEFTKYDNAIILVNKFNTVSHTYALCQKAQLVLSTNNSVAVYCTANQKPAIILNNMYESKIWQNMHKGTAKMLPYSTSIDEVIQECKGKI